MHSALSERPSDWLLHRPTALAAARTMMRGHKQGTGMAAPTAVCLRSSALVLY